MYLSMPIAIQFSVLLLLTIQRIYGCTHGNCSVFNSNDKTADPEDDFILKPNCLKELSSTEKYPYLAMAPYECGIDSGEESAVIISSNRALLHTPQMVRRVGNCTFGLLAGADQYAKSSTKHEAEFIRIGDKGELTLLKLKTPITFGLQAKSIPLVLEKPKIDAPALFITWIFNIEEFKDEGILASNVTVLDQTECRKAVTQNSQTTNQSNRRPNFFCINSFKNPCPYYGSAVLTANGQLAGISSGVYKGRQEMKPNDIVHTFFDIAQYSAAITSHM